MKKETVHRILIDARELIEGEGKWCQGAYAKNGQGWPVSEFSPNACSWCLLGAILKLSVCENREITHEVVSLLVKALKVTHSGELVSYNDSPNRKQKEVVSLLRKAAKLAEL